MAFTLGDNHLPASNQFLRCVFVCFLMFSTDFGLVAQIDQQEINSSPYGVVYNHLYFLQDDSYQPERAALSFRDTGEVAVQQAILLKQVLDGKGLFIDVNRLPKQDQGLDTVPGNPIFYLHPDDEKIYVERFDSLWFYSETTVSQIVEMHESIYPLGIQLSTYFEKPGWQTKLLGLAIYQWLGFAVFFIISVLVFWLVMAVATKLMNILTSKYMPLFRSSGVSVMKLARTLGLIASVWTFLYLLPTVQITPKANSILITAGEVLTIFFSALLLIQITNILFEIFEGITSRTESTLDDQLVPLLRKIVKIIIWVIAVIYVLDNLDVNVTALLAGISLGGLALALAAQDTLKNFFGSIMIFLDKPFQIGDAISFDGVEGTVEEVGLRSTRIRTFANSLVSIPNGALADKVVDNLGLRMHRRFKTVLGIMYDTPPDVIDAFVDGLKRISAVHPNVVFERTEIHLNNLGDSAIEILVYTHFEVENWSQELLARHELIQSFLRLAENLNVSFAFPSQSVYIEKSGNMDKERQQEIGDISTILNRSVDSAKTYFDSNRSKQEPH